jgi:uncharacterized membrane protein YdbT with pleckstrin-like domain
MFDALQAAVLRVAKVPPAPSPPAGGSLQTFRAGASYLRYKQLLWAIGQVSLGTGWLVTLIALRVALGKAGLPAWTSLLSAVLQGLLVFGFAAQALFSYATLLIDFRMRWYMVTDRSLRVREGVFSLREKTMTFANVQALTVEQGPLQRLLGLADVKVQTAGGGSGGHSKEQSTLEPPHEARFRGVENASEIRDLMRERVRQYRDAGLGDTDDRKREAPAPAESLVAARALLDEVKALRTQLGRSPST